MESDAGNEKGTQSHTLCSFPYVAFCPIKLNYLDLSEDPTVNYGETWKAKVDKVLGWYKPLLPEGIEIEQFPSPPLGYRSRCRFVIERGMAKVETFNNQTRMESQAMACL